jgi:hypothetical protein
VRTFLIVLGVFLLLPGGCSLFFIPIGIEGVSAFFKPASYGGSLDAFAGMVWLAGLILGMVGVFLIVRFSKGS